MRIRPPSWRRVGVAALLMVVLGACKGSSEEPALPPRPAMVTVTMREYRFEYDPVVPRGRVVFRFVNAGRLTHQPDLIPLTEDVPPIDQQVRGERRAVVTPFAGIAAREPGEAGTFAVDLEPGQRYAFVCFARDPDDGQSHALQGMTSEFRPPGEREPSPAPSVTVAEATNGPR